MYAGGPSAGFLEVGLDTKDVCVPLTSRDDVIGPKTDVGEAAQHLNSSAIFHMVEFTPAHAAALGWQLGTPADPLARFTILTRGGQRR
jgi:hypothetical protein